MEDLDALMRWFFCGILPLCSGVMKHYFNSGRDEKWSVIIQWRTWRYSSFTSFLEMPTNCSCACDDGFILPKTVMDAVALLGFQTRADPQPTYLTHKNKLRLHYTRRSPALPRSHLSPGHRWFCLQANLNENESLSDVSRKLSNPRRLLWGPGSLFGITAA